MRGRGAARLGSAKGRRIASTRWLTRHLGDPYVQRAQKEGYRSRAAYKLLEIDEKYRLLRPGRRVFDLGSAPGGWLQVATRRGARVVGVDLAEVEPVGDAVTLQGDIFDEATAERMVAASGGRAEVLLSDVAAPATGRRGVDRLRAEAIGEAVLALLPRLLAPGGSLVLKLLRGADTAITGEVRRRFAAARLVRPRATHRESSEIYLVATGYRPPAGAADEGGDPAPDG
ncbi:MAG TPA: RlmE family RNA methyltransferase [Geminicoccaceae bacterium]|nr:RlmE family RNA methyltransferase [Geminicoccaceae bacterium]